MDDRRFDDFTRVAARATSRRQVLKAILGLAAGGVLARVDRPQRARAVTPPIVPGNASFLRTWERTDRPVAEGRATRTWMWGPEPFTEAIPEPYTESPGGSRIVQYYDKSRMEITHPEGDQTSVWYVTNGLLVNELMTGQMQVGDASFESRSPAQVNVAGDADDLDGPTYASFAAVRNVSTGSPGALITRAIRRDGSTYSDARFLGYNVLETQYTAETNHWIAAPFWEFMNSSGMVYENGAFSSGQLFLSAYYATGFPVTDAHWARVRVGGTQKDVLAQCFERRCLTYTPDNAPEWRVEAGNVGRHYHAWRTTAAAPITFAEAPPAVEQALRIAAQQSARYQALVTFFTDAGMEQTGYVAVQSTEQGVVTGTTLLTAFATPDGSAAEARIVFDGVDGPNGDVYAIFSNADGSLAFTVYFDENGLIQAAYPPPPSETTASVPGVNQYRMAHDPQAAGESATAGASPKPLVSDCAGCLSRCKKLAVLPEFPLKYACAMFASAACDRPFKNKKTENVCFIGSYAACVFAQGLPVCDALCRDSCGPGCAGCKANEFCCDDRCNAGQSDANNCGSCGHSCSGSTSGLDQMSYKCCGGTCRFVSSDTENCGQCGKRCAVGEVCSMGTCHDGCYGACKDGQVCCDYRCVDLDSTPLHCGACGVKCSSSQACIDGQCTESCTGGCPTGQVCCGETCADTLSNVEHCGACGAACAAEEICCYGECKDPFKDQWNCGSCSNPCYAPTGACCDGQCIDNLTDPENCLYCGTRCPDNQDCVSGRCLVGNCPTGCLDGWTCCSSGECKDLRADPRNCGTCGNICETNWVCTNGECKNPVCTTAALALGECCVDDTTCDGSEICCSGVCASVLDDENNCGTCGHHCQQGETCCGECVNLNTNREHCGECTFTCESYEVCTGGACVDEDCPNGCPQGQTCCGGCVDLNSNPDHCGECTFECEANEACTGGECVVQGCIDDNSCDGSQICVNNRCIACPGQGCGDFCCQGQYPYCCPTINNCCPSGFPVCPPAGRNSCCSAGTFLCPTDDWCCPTECTCTGSGGCNCNTCVDHDDCTGTDVCIDGECVTCSSAGGQPCMSNDCCGGDYPVCCGGAVKCCPGQYPVCPPSNQTWCCPANTRLCGTNQCCTQTQTCTANGCQSSIDGDVEVKPVSLGGPGRGYIEAPAATQITPAAHSAPSQRN